VKDIRTADSGEIPNRFLKPWQAVVKKQGYRGLEELAQAAAFLTDDQRQVMLRDCRYLKLGDCKEITDVGGWESAALRFYGVLTPSRRRTSHRAGWSARSDAGAAQRACRATYSTYFQRTGVFNNDGLNVNEPEVSADHWASRHSSR